MLIGIFIPKSNQLLQDLVVDRLSTEPDFDVFTLTPDPMQDGRAPLNGKDCDVIVFASSDEAARSVKDLGVCLGQNCVELFDDGRKATSWSIIAASRPERTDTLDSLPDAVRRAATEEWHA